MMDNNKPKSRFRAKLPVDTSSRLMQKQRDNKSAAIIEPDTTKPLSPQPVKPQRREKASKPVPESQRVEEGLAPKNNAAAKPEYRDWSVGIFSSSDAKIKALASTISVTERLLTKGLVRKTTTMIRSETIPDKVFSLRDEDYADWQQRVRIYAPESRFVELRGKLDPYSLLGDPQFNKLMFAIVFEHQLHLLDQEIKRAKS
jgi:hypothetical protein